MKPGVIAFWRRLSTRSFSTTSKFPLTIFFGSQTGKAMGFAHDLNKAAKKKQLDAKVVDLAEFSPSQLNNDGMVVLVTACFGSGEPTDNARMFYNWLMENDRERDKAFFQNVHYAVFGLGQSKLYPERYQKVSVEFDNRLFQLGAKREMTRGEGDDAGDLEGDFEEWQEKFWPVIEKLRIAKPSTSEQSVQQKQQAPPPPPSPSSPPSPPQQKLQSQVQTDPSQCAVGDKPSIYTINNPYHATVTSIQELQTLSSPRSCVHLELNISGTDIAYTTGDYVGVFPKNSTTLIRSLCHHLDLDPVQKVHLAGPLQSHRHFFQSDTPLLEHVLEYCDILTPPKRTFLRNLAEYAAGDQKRKLQFLSSNFPIANADYQNWVVGEMRSVLEVLRAFPSAKMNAEQLLDLLSPLQPRYYSIASSSLVYPTSIQIAAAVVNFLTPTGRRHQGPSTRFLRRFQHFQKVPCFVKTSLFRLPEDPHVPVIMIGGGTGVAPFRAFVQERVFQRKQGKTVGKNVLFCGFNKRSEDYLYDREFEEWEKHGDIILRPAFSHEQEWRYFVQHRMLEDEESSLIWDLISKEDGRVYICGNAQRLGAGGRFALLHIFQQKGKMSLQDAEAYLRDMEKRGAFQMDVY